MITIIDYGMGNIGSIANMIKKVGGSCIIASKAEDILSAKKLILPGVGSFDNGMKRLKDFGFVEILKELVLIKKIPILGICLGMQLLTKSSEEGVLAGLGFVDAVTIKFSQSIKLKIPHMGWNVVDLKKKSSIFKNFESFQDEISFYFVHSYFVKCYNNLDILTATNYGVTFVSAFEAGNIYATQFHPEKSHKYGMQLMKNFVELV